ncbi:MAG: hypothetical protein ABJG88_10435 [Litorimonas sp.]
MKLTLPISIILASSFILGASLQPAYAQSEDIVSILKRQAISNTARPPETIPYIYTLQIDVFGKDDKDDGSDSDADTETDLTDEVENTDVIDEDVDIAIEADLGEDKKKKPKLDNYSAVIEVNPTLIGQARVNIISHTGDPDDEAFQNLLAEFTGEDVSQSDLAEMFWCGSLSDDDDELSETERLALIEGLTVISETPTQAVVKPDLTKMAKLFLDSSSEEASKSEKKMIRRMLKRLDGQITFSKPDGQMMDMKVWMTRSMRVALIAKIKNVEMESSCELAPNGWRYQAQQTMGMKMSAFGFKIQQNQHREIINLQPLP